MDSSAYFLVGFAAIIGYCLPALVAFIRQHPSTPQITTLNLCLGWTVAGWIAALIWATTARRTYRYRLMTVSGHPSPPVTRPAREAAYPIGGGTTPAPIEFARRNGGGPHGASSQSGVVAKSPVEPRESKRRPPGEVQSRANALAAVPPASLLSTSSTSLSRTGH